MINLQKGEVTLFVNGRRLRMSLPSPQTNKPQPTSSMGPQAQGATNAQPSLLSPTMRLPYPQSLPASTVNCVFGNPSAHPTSSVRRAHPFLALSI